MAERKGPLDVFMDLVVYAPLGFWMNLDEVVPELVAKGRQQVTTARMFGQFAVDSGTQELRKRVERLAERPIPGRRGRDGRAGGGDGEHAGGGEGADGADGDGAAQAAERTVAMAAAPVVAPAVPDGDGVDGEVPDAAELAITDYDSLSASQVVPRLEGLSPAEREAVRRYEAANRGRKTILSKIAQLG